MAEKQQDLGKGPVKVPDGLPLTVSTAEEVDLSSPQNVDEWLMAQAMKTDQVVNVVVDHTTREVKPSPGATKA